MMPLLQKGVGIAAGQMPKIIEPKAHAVIDYLVAGSFFMTAAVYWRRNKRAAISSLICGGVTTVNSVLTDYPGGIWRTMSFQTHGKLDAGLAALTATMPRLMGFAGDSESKFFTMQSIAETAITAMTDFECYEHPASDRMRREDEEQIA
jgi:hypothetical protein